MLLAIAVCCFDHSSYFGRPEGSIDAHVLSLCRQLWLMQLWWRCEVKLARGLAHYGGVIGRTQRSFPPGLPATVWPPQLHLQAVTYQTEVSDDGLPLSGRCHPYLNHGPVISCVVHQGHRDRREGGREREGQRQRERRREREKDTERDRENDECHPQWVKASCSCHIRPLGLDSVGLNSGRQSSWGNYLKYHKCVAQSTQDSCPSVFSLSSSLSFALS